MSTNTNTSTSQTSQTSTSTSTWRTALRQAGLQKDEARANTKEAGQAAWAAARAGIEEWLTVKGADPEAQAFHGEVLHYYGKARKGEASKIRTIALATANNGLDPNTYRTLGAAYAAALKLTKIADINATEDEALAAASAAAASAAAASAAVSAATGAPADMAIMIMSLGAKTAVTLMLDALGEDNLPAHRALLRELSKQVGERNEKVQAKTAASKPAKPAKDKTVPKAVASQPAPVQPAKTKPAKTKPAKADVKPAAPVKVKTTKTKATKTKPAKVA